MIGADYPGRCCNVEAEISARRDVTLRRIRMALADAVRAAGNLVSDDVAHDRVNPGWSVEDAVTKLGNYRIVRRTIAELRLPGACELDS